MTADPFAEEIARLEAELGFPLFERSRRGMAITAVAERFHQRVVSLRVNLGEAVREAADLHLGEVPDLPGLGHDRSGGQGWDVKEGAVNAPAKNFFIEQERNKKGQARLYHKRDHRKKGRVEEN